MQQKFFAIDGPEIYIAKTEMIIPEGYNKHKNEVTGDEFPFCCQTHSSIYEGLKAWISEFPNCCEAHKKMVDKWWYKRENYEHLPDTIIQLIDYTVHQIEFWIDKDEWYSEITNYIEGVLWSLGNPPTGFEMYYHYMDIILKKSELIKDKRKKGKIIECLNSQMVPNPDLVQPNSKQQGSNQTDINVLISTYHKWLKVFPFELKSYFGNIKEMYENTYPVLAGAPVYNKYTGLSKAQLHTKASLIEALLKLTNDLLTKVNGLALYESGKLTDLEKYELEIIVNARKLKLQEGYINNSKDEEQKYRKILKEWFRDEQNFFHTIRPYLRPKTEERIEFNADKLIHALCSHGFEELEKVKNLNETQKNELFKLIRSKGMPYCIAMFEFLGFLKHVNMQYISKDKMNMEISKWFQSGKDGRAVKGNISVLNPVSKEDKTKYTAHLHKEVVQKDYQKLK